MGDQFVRSFHCRGFDDSCIVRYGRAGTVGVVHYPQSRRDRVLEASCVARSLGATVAKHSACAVDGEPATAAVAESSHRPAAEEQRKYIRRCRLPHQKAVVVAMLLVINSW